MGIAGVSAAKAADLQLHSFDRRQLTNVYYSEGAAIGDINRDGHPDVVYGPHWYEGPTFEKRHEIYAAKPQPMNFYADNFFTWVYDFNGDGWPDLLVVGLPGTPAFVFENPAGKSDGHWAKHQVFEAVGNESPHFIDLLGDKRPVLVCTYKGAYGFVSPNREHPFEAWTFHAISDKAIKERSAHGLGVGDLNGDGRADVVIASGWFEQPATNAEGSSWRFHEVPFTNSYGGAEMYVYDVNGDGRNDVITSLAAHDFGLAWYEQDRAGNGEVVFRQHIVVGQRPEQNPYGVVFSELHSVALADIDGDGLKDIVTGKTYWSHHKASPQWDAGAVVYWFRLQRNKDGVDWVPYRIDPDAGVGRHIRIDDINGDKLPDIVVGGMKGSHVLTHRKVAVDEATWLAAQPKVIYPQLPVLRRGPGASINSTTGAVEGAMEAELLPIVGTPAGKTLVQDMTGFRPDRFSAGKQLFWTGAKTGDRLELEIGVPEAGEYDVQAVFGMARDYAVIQPLLDGQPLGGSLDLYNFPDVLTTGVQTLGQRQLAAGPHRLGIEIKGANPSATPGLMVGLDYVKLVRVVAAKPRAEAPAQLKLPAEVDLRPELKRLGLSARSQGRRNTCSVFVTAEALEYALALHTGKSTALSVEFMNWSTNQHLGRANMDRGQFFHHLLAALPERGVCPEDQMPYQQKFHQEIAPRDEAIRSATELSKTPFTIHWLKRWDGRTGITSETLEQIRHVLVTGWPVAAGSSHSRLLIGYRDDTSQPGGGVFLVRDSNGGVDTEITFEFARRNINDLFWVEVARPAAEGAGGKKAGA